MEFALIRRFVLQIKQIKRSIMSQNVSLSARYLARDWVHVICHKIIIKTQPR